MSMSNTGPRVTRDRQRTIVGKEFVKRPIGDRKKHFGSNIYNVWGNTMRFFRKRPHTKMSVLEKVEYFTEVDDTMININYARFADSKPKALRLIAV